MTVELKKNSTREVSVETYIKAFFICAIVGTALALLILAISSGPNKKTKTMELKNQPHEVAVLISKSIIEHPEYWKQQDAFNILTAYTDNDNSITVHYGSILDEKLECSSVSVYYNTNQLSVFKNDTETPNADQLEVCKAVKVVLQRNKQAEIDEDTKRIRTVTELLK